MLLIDWVKPLYGETLVEIYVDYEVAFFGKAEEAAKSKFVNRRVKEVYISFDGTCLIISVEQERVNKKK